MSDEESLLQRFTRCFWQEYIEGLCYADYGIDRTQCPRESSAVLDECRLLKDHIHCAGFTVSRNEELEEVSSAGLLFLVLPYTIGDLLYNHSQYDRDNRVSVLKEVKSYWETYLMQIDQLNIVPEVVSLDERSKKIESQLRQNELREVVPQLHFRFCRSGKPSDIDDIRDDVIRLLEFFTHKVRNQLRFVVDEISLLISKPSDSQESVQPSHSGKSMWSMKLDRTMIRSIMQENVFRPDISMPTITLDEFARMEYERALRSKTETAYQNRDSEDDFYVKQRMEELEQEEKDRNWDDWKDDNPRGSGNKLVNKG